MTGLRWERRVPLVDKPRGSTGGTGKTPVSSEEKLQGISREAEDFLIRVKKDPLLSVTEFYSALKLSAYKGNKIKTTLIRAGLVREVEVPTNRRGRRRKILEPTPRGNDYVKSLGVAVKTRGRGGALHRLFQDQVKSWYVARGYRVELEATMAGGITCFDVLAIGENGERVGVEIERTSAYSEVNLRQALASGVDEVVFVCDKKNIQDRIRDLLSAIGPLPTGRREWN